MKKILAMLMALLLMMGLLPASAEETSLVLIEGSRFQMDSPEDEPWRSADEVQHDVTISSFYLSPYDEAFLAHILLSVHA